MEPPTDDGFRRNSVKFAKTERRRVFDPDATVSTAQDDENTFRVPLLPSALKTKQAKPKSPLKARNVPPVAISQLSISPGTSATEEKKAAMLARLEKRRSTIKNKWARDKEEGSSRAIDVEATERSFLEQSFDEPPTPRFSDISSICPSDTFLVTTPRRSEGPLCSTPFRKSSNGSPRTARAAQSTTSVSQVTSSSLFNQSAVYESVEDITDRQFNALSVWCNMLLNTCNRFEDGIVDLGKTKQEATKKLQELLNKQGKEANTEERAKFTYTQFLERQQFETLRIKAQNVYRGSDSPQKILSMVQNSTVTIREGLNVYNDISLKTTLLQVFLSFHPVWLHLGMETVFGERINIDGASFLATMSRFINTRVFSDPQIMKMKKYAVGTVKLLVTPAGRDALHRHFIIKILQFLYCVEVCKTAGVIPSDPRMFTKKSSFKSLPDVFSELSREVLSGMPLPKALTKIGFQPTYKQTYFDNLEYKIDQPSDLCDGVMLGKLVEVVCVLGRSVVMSKLRNPGGDRLRKVGNVTTVIDCATKAGVDCGNVKPEAIVGGNREAILELLWRLVGVFVLASGGNSDELRRESLRLHFDGEHIRGEGLKPEDFLLNMCQQLGFTLGVQVNSLDDLRDGRLLATIWRTYNPHGSEIHFYPGSSLFKKVVAAAETELGLPVGLHGALPLFVHMFLTRIFNIRRLNESATRIQRAFRSHLFFKRLRAYMASDEYAAEKEERARRMSLVQNTFTVNSEDQGALMLQKIIAEQREKAAVLIQAAFRGLAAKRTVASMREDRQRYLENVVRVQRALRGFLARRQYAHLRAQRIEEEKRYISNVVLVQAFIRGHLARKQYKEWKEIAGKEEERRIQKEKEEEAKRLRNIVFIQASMRGFLARRRYAQLKEAEERRIQKEREEEAKRLRNIVIIQASMRGFLARRRYVQLKETEDRRIQKEREEEAKRLRNIVFIQAAMRGFLARRQYAQLREAEERRIQKEREEEAIRIQKIVLVQACMRGFLARRRNAQLREAEERRIQKIILIQACMRRFLARRQYIQLREAEERRIQKEREAAAKRIRQIVLVQASMRGFLARRRYAQLKEEADLIRRAEEERRLHKEREEETKRVRNIIFIQACMRGFLARRRFVQLKEAEERRIQKEREEEAKKIQKIVLVQAFIRGCLARKRYAAEKERLGHIILVQAAFRGFLARRRMDNELNQSIAEVVGDAQEEAVPVVAETEPTTSSCVSTPVRATKSSDLLEKLRYLYVETKRLKSRQTSCEKLLLLAKKVKGHKEREAAAIKIQAWWRGCRVRREFRPQIAERMELMDNYRQDLANLGDDETCTPAMERLKKCEGQLFEQSLYRVKVAATVIKRLISLSPSLLDHFVVNCGGINAVLDRLEQCDRSPPMVEIVTLVSNILLKIVKAASERKEVAAFVESFAADVLMLSFHVFHAFYSSTDIVVATADTIIALKAVVPDAKSEKAPFYLKQATTRFSKLDDTDERKTALLRLNNALL